MSDELPEIFDIAGLASVLSLELEQKPQALAVSRHGYSVALPCWLIDRLESSDPTGRHLTYGILFGVRLAIDRSAADFDLSNERQEKPAKVFHHHEIPSVYGDRLPRIVPDSVLEWFEELTGETLVSTPAHIDGLSFVYILETGKYLHALAESDVAEIEMTRDRLLSDARHALFYDSYKLEPRQKERTEGGLVRIFRTSEGLGASRAMLLPDFDYDAAREHGCFSIPSRDTLVVGRPAKKEFSETIFEQVSNVTAELIVSEAFPLCSMVFRMTATSVKTGEFVGGPVLPPDSEQSATKPPEGTVIEVKEVSP